MTVVTVTPEEFDRLTAMIENPPEPSPALREMLSSFRKRFPARRGTLTLADGIVLEVEESYRGGPWYVVTPRKDLAP